MTTDRTVETKDTSAETPDTSKVKQETPTAKAYQESEVQKIVNDRLAQAGRDAKTLEAQKADLAARETAHQQWLREKDEEEYEKARGNPEALTSLQREREVRAAKKEFDEAKAAFEREKLEHQVELDTARALTKERKIAELAQKYQVDTQTLKDLDLDIEHTEKVAQKMTKLSPEELAPVIQAKEAKKRDSGITIGGTGDKSIDQRLKERYPTM